MFTPEIDNTTKIVDAAIKGVQALSDKIGVASGQLWDVLVMQGWIELVKNGLIIVLFPFFTWWLLSTVRNAINQDSNYDEFLVFVSMIAEVGAFIFFVMACCSLMTPQMYAVSRILEAIK